MGWIGGVIRCVFNLDTRYISALRSGRLTPGEPAPGIHWTEAWVGPPEPVWTRW